MFGLLSNAKLRSYFSLSILRQALYSPMGWTTSPSNVILSMSLLPNFLIVADTGHPVIAHCALTVYNGADFFSRIIFTNVIILERKTTAFVTF